MRRFRVREMFDRWVRSRQELLHRLEILTEENGKLSSRLSAAQQTAVSATKQAEELRREKERLRGRVRSLKSELDLESKKSEILSTRITELRTEIEDLKNDEVFRK